MRRYRIRLLVALLTEILLLCGCGGVSQVSVVELIEPVAANAAYRPVEMGTIGETKVLYGTVVSREYCCFYDNGVTIKEIAVDIGDYVEAGDIVAYVDIDAAREELANLKLQWENLQRNYELETQISRLEIEQATAKAIPIAEAMERVAPGNEAFRNEVLGISVSGNDASGGEASENDRLEKLMEEYQAVIAQMQERKWTDIAIAQENLRYDGILHEYRVGKLQEMINDKQELITDGKLRASHSGYVVYVKSMGAGTYADAYENIVVLSDPEETYIELNKTIDKYAYKDYEVKYLQLAGKPTM